MDVLPDFLQFDVPLLCSLYCKVACSKLPYDSFTPRYLILLTNGNPSWALVEPNLHMRCMVPSDAVRQYVNCL